ncbi:MAG: hypothetical protein ABIQ53_07490, partial [Terracoccus sp.]
MTLLAPPPVTTEPLPRRGGRAVQATSDAVVRVVHAPGLQALVATVCLVVTFVLAASFLVST